MTDLGSLPAFGGPGWAPRRTSLREELGTHWAACGLDSEWGTLRAVLLHRPGRELERAAEDPQAFLFVEGLDPARAQLQHDELARTFRSQGVQVQYVDPPRVPSPNQLFCADLMAMTPSGAVLARPASEVRAGEERWVARSLGEMGIPLVRSVGGRGHFEGADLMWLAHETALLATGLRTDDAGAHQVATALEEMGVRVVRARMPGGNMHLMGQLRILDRDLAVGWGGRLSDTTMGAVREAGFELHLIPDQEEAVRGQALNVVTLGPRRIVMPAGNPVTHGFFQDLGVECVTVEVDEIGKAAGGIGCMTAILEREMVGPAPGLGPPAG